MKGTEMVTDSEGSPLKEGTAVTAWYDDKSFTATVKAIKPREAGDGNFRRVVLIRDDDHAEVESYSDAVLVVVGDDEVLLDTNLTAVVDTWMGAERAVIRLSGRAGLHPVDVGQLAADSRTQEVRDALMAVPQVAGVAVVATESNRKRNIVVHWEAGADGATVSQRAWQAVADLLPNV
jgi:hypothetical protein